jgi:hypothetical protein
LSKARPDNNGLLYIICIVVYDMSQNIKKI